MSLINDALKKSGQNKFNPKGGPQMEPAGDQKSGGGKGFTVFLICFVLAGAAALGAWNYWNKKYKNGATGDPKAAAGAYRTNSAGVKSKVAAPPAATNNNPIARAKAVFNRVLDRNTEGEAEAGAMQKTAPASGAETATAAPTTPAAGKTMASPILLKPKSKAAWIPGLPRVQAIIYKENDPTALIEGKTIRAGDKVGEALILEVKKDMVVMKLGNDTHEVSVR
jgi:hypothetical protein